MLVSCLMYSCFRKLTNFSGRYGIHRTFPIVPCLHFSAVKIERISCSKQLVCGVEIGHLTLFAILIIVPFAETLRHCLRNR